MTLLLVGTSRADAPCPRMERMRTSKSVFTAVVDDEDDDDDDDKVRRVVLLLLLLETNMVE